MPVTNLPSDHHVIRNVPWGRLRKDENDNVLGVLGMAFRLRDRETYLSATWLEYFPGERSAKIEQAVKAVRASKLDVKPKSAFAIGCVGRIKEKCIARRHQVRIVHQAEADNLAHAAIRKFPAEDDELLDLLAAEEWSELVMNADVPAGSQPAPPTPHTC